MRESLVSLVSPFSFLPLRRIVPGSESRTLPSASSPGNMAALFFGKPDSGYGDPLLLRDRIRLFNRLGITPFVFAAFKVKFAKPTAGAENFNSPVTCFVLPGLLTHFN